MLHQRWFKPRLTVCCPLAHPPVHCHFLRSPIACQPTACLWSCSSPHHTCGTCPTHLLLSPALSCIPFQATSEVAVSAFLRATCNLPPKSLPAHFTNPSPTVSLTCTVSHHMHPHCVQFVGRLCDIEQGVEVHFTAFHCNTARPDYDISSNHISIAIVALYANLSQVSCATQGDGATHISTACTAVRCSLVSFRVPRCRCAVYHIWVSTCGQQGVWQGLQCTCGNISASGAWL